MSAPERRPCILSGVQPSGRLHLGNWFGAIRRHIGMQQDGDCFFFIADYHALTTIRDARELQANTRDVALTTLRVASIRSARCSTGRAKCPRSAS